MNICSFKINDRVCLKIMETIIGTIIDIDKSKKYPITIIWDSPEYLGKPYTYDVSDIKLLKSEKL